MKLCPRKIDKKLILYGYGTLGRLAEEVFKELKIPIYLIVDHTNQAAIKKGIKESSLIAVCVASEPYLPIAGQLEKDGWPDIVPVYDIIEAYPQVGIHNGWFAPKLGDMKDEEIYEIDRVLDYLRDYRSKAHYESFLQWHLYRCEKRLKLPPRPSLPSTLADIRHRQTHGTIWLDQPVEKVSIHNEGNELSELIANMWVFKKYRPVIEVACYHSRDGLWKIPKYLMDNLKDYTFKFRLHAYMGQGAFLYAAPKERLDK